MPAPRPIPDPLLVGPFTSSHARELGVSEKVLRGSRFRRLLPRVWMHVDHELTDEDRITAARLALPDRAQVSHQTRLRLLGLEIGPQSPVHFTVSGDLHIDLDDVFLHRTERLPPTDDVGVTPGAAFIQFCATATLLEAIQAGDWLLHRELMTVQEVGELARHDDWRPGSAQARRVVPLLDSRARSLPESELRCVMIFAGLPTPEVNVPILDHPTSPIVDLLVRRWMLAVEYEGRQHAEDAAQFQRDITRYALLRDIDVAYVQVTRRMLDQRRTVAMTIYRALVARGYDGPPPSLGARWASLDEPIRVIRWRQAPLGGE